MFRLKINPFNYKKLTRSQFLRWGLLQTIALIKIAKLVTFEVIKVDERGKIVKRNFKQALSTTYILRNDVEIEFIYIPGGSFLRGSPLQEKYRDSDESPQHLVKIAPFWMSKYPITQAQYRAITGVNPSGFSGHNHPVERVSWYDALRFCAIASQKLRKTVKLPSEAQWEYACRAGNQTTFSFGDTLTANLANYRATATYAQESPGIFRAQTTEVGIFPPNAFGIHDLHGNVWEWCADTYQDNYQQAPTDDRSWVIEDNDHLHVLRGGSWFVDPRNCRSAVRVWDFNSVILHDVGFRVIISR
ncbi:formylglycine-generating enzyme family protein [Gloeocapsa sp. PCC 73106]|uniref:formylglycine-generating enzyme family protein n=1 Tax=Gloeocapsa sp. PCC 73106 TaxID=102232 RepID=UPI0002AC085A|nr:formylglycine-generating enzyme family protein [Gloeocapsa sp. PCC 73106]ELR97853.1 hypothetical protein GLO73106DRAFT_00016700 [Gloeocapsa sp. PCC 73106]